MGMHLCLSKYLDSMVCHLKVQACIAEKRFPFLSKLFLPFLPTVIKRRHGKFQPCFFLRVGFRPLMGKGVTLDSGWSWKKQTSVFQNSIHLRNKTLVLKMFLQCIYTIHYSGHVAQTGLKFHIKYASINLKFPRGVFNSHSVTAELESKGILLMI